VGFDVGGQTLFISEKRLSVAGSVSHSFEGVCGCVPCLLCACSADGDSYSVFKGHDMHYEEGWAGQNTPMLLE
jgi:hypothetical protein